MEDLSYKLDQYEGPLDLLLSLIAKNKVNIIDISISEICDQYMQYIEEARKMDLEIASEFIRMASELMLLKSRMLLPKNDDEDDDPRAELIDTLLLYQKAKDAAKAQSARAVGAPMLALERNEDAEPISRRGSSRERSKGEEIGAPRIPIKAENKRR
jgi:segregation and condensation protein A